MLDLALFISIIAIWLILVVNVILVIAGYIGYLQQVDRLPRPLPKKVPFVSIMVPAHNEGVVIVKTVEALLRFDYPHDHYEIIVINDNSDDNSAELLAQLQAKHPNRHLKVVNTDKTNGGKGKSNALNIGLTHAKGDIISIYDADNTPEKPALRVLVGELMADPQLGAVIGKFRTRNKNATLLTRFINIETLPFSGWHKLGGKNYFICVQFPEQIM
ncbi:n-acetylglucosaminyltransferase [Loigolactobacillus rennini DSM 20253]|uniref:N-acetylglucosaminyltransferase n=1 Tax=Loigolactobacillus rennini DSM 20253 TaxID=1423796 RepID=A0A0R2CZD8_9LACO|nr:n-acetylglucosaminyltransferase [Loigolactobacillus rennini DSM 20253]